MENDEDLRSEVESLLASDSDAENVLHSLVAGDIERLTQDPHVAPRPDQQLGPIAWCASWTVEGWGSSIWLSGRTISIFRL